MILLLFSCHKKEKSFYEIKSINKDSSQIIWGNSSFKNSQNFENFVLDKDKIKTKWKNETEKNARKPGGGASATRECQMGLLAPPPYADLRAT